ncbi:Hypothetical predicted protein [Octopus vulgaris]|uniref:Uncharacterized protein n=1 Tax=Octopus vulgaris TaxID=6645 RepID=A0AA36FAL4_OCTVU|nr:Hypothetical predicted protein [Octopus vulgaris]
MAGTEAVYDLDNLLINLKTYGNYQIRQLLVVSSSLLIVSHSLFQLLAIGYTPDHQCKDLSEEQLSIYNVTSYDDISYEKCHINIFRGLKNITDELSCINGHNYSANKDISFVIEVNGKAVYLVYSQQVSVLKEYDVGRRYETHRADKYNNLQGQMRREKVNILLADLKKQQPALTQSRDISEAAVKASYLVASKLYCEDEFVKIYIQKAAEIVRPEKQQTFSIRNRSLNHRQFHNFLSYIGFIYGLPYQTEVRWLSRGDVLKRSFNPREKIEQFMENKGKPVLDFQSPEWLQHLAFNEDITEHLNNLNKMLQGLKDVLTQYFESIRAFKWKLTLWETQLSGGDPFIFVV